MSGIEGKSSVVRTLRNLRIPVGVEYSQLTPGSPAGPTGNPEGEAEMLPAHSGKLGEERFEVQDKRSSGMEYAVKEV
jgi:hypothetical protein